MMRSGGDRSLSADFERYELACRMMVERSLQDAAAETDARARGEFEAHAKTYQILVDRLKRLRKRSQRAIPVATLDEE
jgi:hypothetical protein